VELRDGYKQTEIGVIPRDWGFSALGALTDPRRPISYGIVQTGPGVLNGVRCLRVVDVQDGRINKAGHITTSKSISAAYARTILQKADLVMPLRGKVGEVALVDEEIAGSNLTRGLALIAARPGLSPSFLRQALSAPATRSRLEASMNGSALQEIPIATLRAFDVALPPTKAEQETIAGVLGDADDFVESLVQLLAKKRHVKEGAMHELLTGKKRLQGFGEKWATYMIQQIADPSSEKAVQHRSLPVLTCSKHLGFVDSLRYFKNQVFSDDTTGYKVVKRGQIAYPANHVEEGSIGLQDLYDVALVSPIYVVFSTKDGVDSYFLHRLLKLDSYRQRFSKETASSVDRRGSLRWPAFSKISVELPPLSEQKAIGDVLRDCEAEIAALEAKLTKARQIKQGMMQELLTGRIRLV